jgi:tetratricopeptide (TPR) repeat protein
MVRKENPAAGKDVDHRLAILYGEVGKPQKAMEELQKLLASNPRDVDLLNDLGQCYYDLGSWSQAEKYFRQALDVNPQYQRGWVNLGLTLGQEERYDEARDAFLKAVSPCEAECNLGFVYMTQGKRTEARDAYQRAVTADPTSQLARAALQKLDTGGSAADLVRPTAERTPPAPEPTPEPSQPDK